MGSTYEGGLDDFYVNTAQPHSLLVATIGGFVVSCVVCVAVSLFTHKIKSDEDARREWAKTISIDNPLNPFRLVYEDELKAVGAGAVVTAETMGKVFRRARMYATVGGISSIIIFLVVIPAIAWSFEVLDLDQFSTWLKIVQIYCFVCTVVVVVVPPFEEGMQIWKKYQRNKAMLDSTTSNNDTDNFVRLEDM